MAARDAVEERDLGLPAIGVGVAMKARDPGESFEAVQAMTVERDIEV